MSGWIKIHRKILDWEWYTDSDVKSVFLHLLLCSNVEDKTWRGMLIKRGQMFTSVNNLAKDLKLSDKKIRRVFFKLKMTNEVVIKGASNGTMITVCKYEDYQDNLKQMGEQMGEQNGTKRATTKEYKKKEVVIIDDVKSSYNKSIEIYNNFILSITGIKPVFNGKQGNAMKLLINYIYKNSKDTPPTNESIYNGLNYIFGNYDKWSEFHKKNTELSFIHSKIVDIIKDIQDFNKKQKENRN